MAQETKLGVYVSVPFCRAKCSFCNFASGVGTPAALESYVNRLCAEIDAAAQTADALAADLPRAVDTLYFGGGTPSLLEPAQLRRIFVALRRQFDVAADAEITLEAAPGQIAPALLEEAQRLGVNRVSLGVQSFVDRECAAVGRLHSGRECADEIVRLRAAGLVEVGADLIAGLPYQIAGSWAHSLEVARDLAAEGALTHLSVYMLEVDEDSRLGREVIAGGLRFHAPRVPPDEQAAEFYEQACARLTGNPECGGRFAQYEISNFAAAGSRLNSQQAGSHQCRHNLKYWERAPYLGFGLDAHSMLHRGGAAAGMGRGSGGVRFANADELEAYREGKVAEVVSVGQREAYEETLFLGLRMNRGIAVERLRSEFPVDWIEASEEAAGDLFAEKLMEEQDGFWRLTLRGRLLSNEVFGRLLLTVPA